MTSLFGVVLVLAGCTAEAVAPADLPEVQGEWTYRGFDIRMVGRNTADRCEITDLRMVLGPWRTSGFFGRTEGGTMRCGGELATLSGPLPSYPVRRGGSVLNFIAFDIGSSDWRHDGVLSGDTMSGRFWIQQPTFRLEGSFEAVQVSR